MPPAMHTSYPPGEDDMRTESPASRQASPKAISPCAHPPGVARTTVNYPET